MAPAMVTFPRSGLTNTPVTLQGVKSSLGPALSGCGSVGSRSVAPVPLPGGRRVRRARRAQTRNARLKQGKLGSVSSCRLERLRPWRGARRLPSGLRSPLSRRHRRHSDPGGVCARTNSRSCRACWVWRGHHGDRAASADHGERLAGCWTASSMSARRLDAAGAVSPL